MSGRGASPGLGAVLLIAVLATAGGLALASAVLTLPEPLDRSHAAVIGFVVLSQGLAWWWSRRRQRGFFHAALRLAAQHPALALWAAADLAALALLWGQGTARWSQVAPVWNGVAAYVAARAALLALGVTIGLARRAAPRGRAVEGGGGGGGRGGSGVRLTVLGAALAAPALAALAGALPAWQNAVAGGLLALLALAACASSDAARQTWVGLAALLASPALALGGSALLLGSPTLPLAAPLALSALLPALGLAALATPAALTPADRD